MQNRYSRQILFQDIGEKGQRKINEKTVLIVGMGALGTHLAEGLVRAGIKKLRLIDRDYIEALTFRDKRCLMRRMQMSLHPKSSQLNAP